MPGPTDRPTARTAVPARGTGSRPAPSHPGPRARRSAASKAARAAEDRRPIPRFDTIERTAHWCNATLILVLVLTGMALYIEPIMALVGRRLLIQDIHVYTGVFLPVPLLISVIGYWGKGLREDVSRLNRWIPDDRTWLRVSFADKARRRSMRAQLRLGKFNAGQKLNAAFTIGAILIMLGTGIMLKWYHPFPLAWRTGATFVHDWLAIFMVVVIFGHICFALKDPEALRSIFTGKVTRGWAKRHAPAWLVEVESPTPIPPAAPAPSPSREAVTPTS